MNLRLLLFLLTGLMAGLPVHSQSPDSARSQSIRIRDASQTYEVLSHCQLLEVASRSVSIQDLLQKPDQYRFVPYEPNRLKTRFTQSNAHLFGYWFAIDLTNETDQELFLRFVYSGTEIIDVYEVAGNQLVAVHKIGSLESERVYPFRKSNPFCPLRVSRGQTSRIFIYQQGVYTAYVPVFCSTTPNLLQNQHRADLFYGLYYGFILIIVLYNLILYLRVREPDHLFYGLWVLLMGVQVMLYRGHLNEFFYAAHPEIERYGAALAGIIGLCHILFTLSFLRLRELAPRLYRVGIGILGLFFLAFVWDLVAIRRGALLDLVPLVSLLEGVFSVTAGVVVYRLGFRPALYYIFGNIAFFACLFAFLFYAGGRLPYGFFSYNSILLGSGIEILLFTLALAYKITLMKHDREQAETEQFRLLDENQRLISEQNSMLEEKVTLRTAELNQTLKNLKDTQSQLIHAEKMASLGELVAGIAHEIQNPLNFVNNFAEVSVELVDELKEEKGKGPERNDELEDDLLSDLSENLQKITQHGKRAEGIVKGMLQHSRSSTGERQPTNLNALADEYLRLAYHGLRAKDKEFNAQLVTDFAADLGLIDAVPQDLGRVLLNLFNNAFYAVHEKAKSAGTNYRPSVEVCTARQNGQVVIKVKDNGTGMPESVRQKIFQPFFTTKPPGQGTGLGLSLSYDIVTKGHGGELSVTSTQGEGTEITVRLPG
ncbi:MAG: hypothetical protein LH606_00885 [Cytophagaceae bacterium]|nr:hypothetical protein [Cytophagaceae bacterium]